MTIEQAVAILEAERVLQHVGCEGPDCNPGSAWFGYIEEAVKTLQNEPLYCDEFDDLYNVQDVKAA